MRPVSLVVLLAIAGCVGAQTPLGFGPGTLGGGRLAAFDWYGGTPTGCTAGARGICVGPADAVWGDSIYFTGWYGDASQLPVTTGLPIIGTLNDFQSKTCGGNLMVIQLAAFSWSSPNSSYISEVNCMAGYGASSGNINTPSGWYGHCTSGDDGAQECTWKSRAPFVRGGLLYLPVERQISAGTRSIHDATLVVSADGGQTWKNPYTVAHGGAASATGDAPACGAAAQGAGNACTDATYSGALMWKSLPLEFTNWVAVQYGQDGGTMPSGVADGCDPATYTCFMAGDEETTVARVLNTDLPSLDVTKWQYYTCPAITDTYRCPGSQASSWTSTFANRTRVVNVGINNTRAGSMASFFGVAYIKEFKSYVMTGWQKLGSGNASVFLTAPSIQGPWTPFSGSGVMPGFLSPSLALTATVSSNPPRVQLTTVRDEYTHVSDTSPYFDQWDLVPGKTPALQGGESARYARLNGAAVNAGFIFSDSHAPGTIPRKGLQLAYDFYDHGGDTTAAGFQGFHDLAGGGAFLAPCYSDGAVYCGTFNAGHGLVLTSFGATLGDGYTARMVTMLHDMPQTVAIGATQAQPGGTTPANAPSAMQGNGTFTVVGVFRYDSGSFGQVPVWYTGDFAGSNTAVALSYPSATGGPLELGWGGNSNRWRFNSGFTLTAGNWYFIACTVQANGATPVAHLWMGSGGALVDRLAGVARASTGGSPTQTPSVSAGPLYLSYLADNSHVANASHAGLFFYNRVLSQAEAGLMYRTLKTKMALRGVTLQ